MNFYSKVVNRKQFIRFHPDIQRIIKYVHTIDEYVMHEKYVFISYTGFNH